MKTKKTIQHDFNSDAAAGPRGLLAFVPIDKHFRQDLIVMIALLIISILVFGYLLYALIKPEKF